MANCSSLCCPLSFSFLNTVVHKMDMYEKSRHMNTHRLPPSPLSTLHSLFNETMRFVLLFTHLSACLAFAPPASLHTITLSPSFTSTQSSSSSLYLSDNDRRQSRFEGMQREPSQDELSIMDDMITKLSSAKPYELPNAVSRAIRVVSSPRFFLRIAERADAATDPDEKERLSAFADNLVNTIQAVVSMTEDSLDERAKDVERVVKAASEPESGEFLVPLSKERVDAMRVEMEKLEIGDLNEGFLSTVDAWMNKAHQVSLFVLICRTFEDTLVVLDVKNRLLNA